MGLNNILIKFLSPTLEVGVSMLIFSGKYNRSCKTFWCTGNVFYSGLVPGYNIFLKETNMDISEIKEQKERLEQQKGKRQKT
jgi:hypothetical protein